MTLPRRLVDLRTVADWGPPALVAVLSQLPLGLEEPWAAGRAALAITGASLAVPLLWRTTRPLTVCGVVAVAMVGQVTVGGTLNFGALVAALIAIYSASRYAARLRSALGGALLVLAAVAVVHHDLLLAQPLELAFPAFYFGTALALGRVVALHSGQAAELRRLNDELAARQHDAARLAVAAERVRLARDLHDSVAHTVMVMVVQADAGLASLERHGPDERDLVAGALEQIKDTGQRGLRDLRGLVRMLRDDEQAPSPGLTDLDVLVTVLARAGLRVEVHRDPDLDSGTPPTPAASSDLFRVCQEALTNVLKHSESTTAEVRLARDATAVTLEVRDPGPARPTAVSGGAGLVGMRERLAPHGGCVEAGDDGGGFRVRARVPMPSRVEPVETR